MKGNKKAIIVIVLLVLLGITTGYVSSAYAKYASEITGNQGTVKVAKWAFSTDNATQSINVNLKNTVVASSLIANRIAPGTEGDFALVLTNANTETGVAFTVAFTATNKPTNLKLYKTRSGSAGSYVYSNEITPGTTTITGKLAAEDGTGLNVPIYWQWAYGSSDSVSDTVNAADTTNGVAGDDMTIEVTITGIQTNPADAVTTGLD
jgi:hypothetical protein